MSKVRAILVLHGVLIAYLFVLPAQIIGSYLYVPLARRSARYFFATLCWLLNIQYDIGGTPNRGGGTVFISNHASYIDVLLLGAVLEANFVAKKEVGGWPLFGILSRFGRTIFVNRERRSDAGNQSVEISARLAGGDSIIIFPEGTSSDGNRVLPFKSSLLSVSEIEFDEPVNGHGRPQVQPITIAYVGMGGLPLGRRMRHLVSWFGDMDLAPHLWALLQAGGPDIQITFHEPVSVEQLGSRKKLARHCEVLIEEHLRDTFSGEAGTGFVIPRKTAAL